MNIFLTLFSIIYIVFLFFFMIFEIIYDCIDDISLNLYKYKVRFVENKKIYGKIEYVCEYKVLCFWVPFFSRDTLEECKRCYKMHLRTSLRRRKKDKIIYKKVINN